MATIAPSVPLASQLRYAITRTARRLRQEADAGLTPTLVAGLATIARHGPLTPSELADRERIKRPTATRLIAKLEALGMVERAAHADDRRSTQIAATHAGHELIRTLQTRKDAFLAVRLRRLSAEDRRTLRRAAEILEQLLDD